MSTLHALILALIQGITEFLPVSSKSHMALYQLWFGSGSPDVAYEFALHIGTIAATMVYFRKDLIPVIKDRKLLLLLFITTCLILLAWPVHHLAERLLGSELAIAAGFIVTGVMLLSAERMGGALEQAGMKQAVAIGVAQAMAVWPGISRSGSTAFAALVTGLKPAAAFRYIFLCSIPALSGVALYELLKGLRHRGDATAAALTVSTPVLLAGILVSGVTGYFALHLLDQVFIRRRLAVFGAYVLGLSAVIFVHVLWPA